jgi:site-specific DNA-methyltransferase (cytosine-N4-specific)
MLTTHKIIIGNSNQMYEVADSSIDLMITSPPYPMIKMWDDQFFSLNPLIKKLWDKLLHTKKEKTLQKIYRLMHDLLNRTWQEAFRVIKEGGIACINIGDATRKINGSFRLFSNHSKIIESCEKIGFTSLPYILWKKPTNKPQYRGKNVFLGSGFLPPNAYITIDCEFILIFRKGRIRKFQPHDKLRYDSAFTKDQRNQWFSQIWSIKGAKQKINKIDRKIASFPAEIVNRLIRMFSVKNDTILDPFLGSGTTTKLAIKNKRNSIGYEIDEKIFPLLENQFFGYEKLFNLHILKR